MKLSDLVVGIGADTRGLTRGLNTAQRKVRDFSRAMQSAGKTMSASITAPVVALGAAATKTAANFEFSMAKVQAVSGFTADEMQRLEKQAKDLGGSTSKSASDVAQLQLELAKLGKTSTEIEAMTESVLSLSIAFDTDLGDTSRVVGESLNQFGLNADQAGRVADNMAILFGSSALDLEKFGTAMSVVGPTAAAMGLSIEETGAAIGTLVNAGVDASTAGTSLTKALTTLAAEGMTGKQAMKSLFTGSLSVAQGFEFFGDRAGKIIPILQKSGESMANLTQKQIEGNGAALKARQILENTAQGGFDKLKSSLEALAIAFGQTLLPLVNQATAFFAGLASQFASLDENTKRMVVQVGMVAAAIGPLMVLIPKIAGLIAAIASPVGLTIAAVALLATAIYTFSDEVGQALAPVINWFISLYNESTMVRIAIGHIKGMVKVVFDFFGFAINTVIEGLKDVGAVLKAVFTGDLGAVPGLVSDAFSRAADRMAEFGRKAAEDYKASVENELKRDPIELVTPESISEGIKSLGGLRDAFDALFAGGGAGGGGGAGDGGSKRMSAMGKKMQNALQPAQLMAGGGPIAAMADGVDSAIGRMDERIMGFKNTMMDMYDALSQGAAQFGNEMGHAFGAMAQGAEDGKERMKEATKGIINQSLAAAQASIIEAMINSGKFTGPAAPIVIPALVATGIGLVQSLFSGIPAFADGGIVSGPTLGLMGEYPGARSNPEVIAPLDKLQGMLQASPVVVTGRISGNDIRLSNDRSNRNAKRFLR